MVFALGPMQKLRGLELATLAKISPEAMRQQRSRTVIYECYANTLENLLKRMLY